MATALVLLAGCSGATDEASGDASPDTGGTTSEAAAPEELTPVKFQTSWIPMVQFGGSYIAKDVGYYEQQGLDVEILPGGPEVDGMALLASESVDIAVSNADAVARANAEGADLVIVAAGFQRNPLGLLSMADNPIEEPEDMYGKTIGVPSGDNASHDALVSFNDLDAGKITTVPAGFDVAPLVSGEVDGLYVFYTEQPIALEEQGYEGTTMLLADYGLDVYAQVYAVRRETLETQRDMIASFLTAEIMGWQDFVDDQTDAVDLAVNDYGKDTGLSETQQTKQAERQLELLVTDDTEEHGLLWMTADGITANLETIAGLGVEGADESMFDTSLLEDIYQGASSL